MNYDPNLNFCGKRTNQIIRLTFGRWIYRKTIDITVRGNVMGLSAIGSAVGIAYDKLDQESCITMTAPNGDELECVDDAEEGEDWLGEMLISAEIIEMTPVN